MRILLLLVLIAGVAAELLDGIDNIDVAPEPMVAFACGRPSLYKIEQKWEADRTQNCLSKPEEIVAYCALKFPQYNITNFVPASTVEIVDWQSLTGSTTEKISVRPYRCIAQDFSSDALLVPESCKFAHFEHAEQNGNAVCNSYNEWNATAHQRCAESQLTLYSFSVIVPCSVGTFGGVEYVCCPKSNSTAVIDQFFDTMPKPAVDAAATDLSTAKTDDVYYSNEAESAPMYQDDDAVSDSSDDYAAFDSYDPATNYYVLYMETPEKLGKNEHEAYSKAMLFTKRYYEDEQKRLDKQLAELNVRYKDLTAKNVTMAKTLYSKEEQTLKNLFKKVKETWASIRSEMNSEHERRVSSALENRRLDRIENFMNALDEAAEYDDLQAVKPLVQALKQYIYSEEKERIHWINRYEHMLDTNPDEAERTKMTIREMLLQIQQRINSVTQSLKRVPRIKATVRSLLSEILNEFNDVDQEVRFLFPDLDLASDFENLIPELQEVTTPGMDDLMVTELELDSWVTPNWFDKRNLVGTVSNRTLLVVIGASVTSAVMLTIVFIICCARKCCNSTTGRLSSRKSHLRTPSHIFHVPTGPILSCKDTFSDLPIVIPRSLATDDANLRKMQMRGYENPMEDGCLTLQDSETAALVNNDANELMRQSEDEKA